jgi:alkylation response protein AidB-like acyl-CoA dehydrogenase
MAADTDAMFTPDQEEQAIRDAVRGIVDSFGPDYYQQQVDDGANCAELWDALGTKGYLGVHLPEKYGGGGLGLRELAIVVQETALGGCPLQAMLFSAGVTGTILNRSASDEQNPRWLPGAAAGETRLSFAITEPDAGSNAPGPNLESTRSSLWAATQPTTPVVHFEQPKHCAGEASLTG